MLINYKHLLCRVGPCTFHVVNKSERAERIIQVRTYHPCVAQCSSNYSMWCPLPTPRPLHRRASPYRRRQCRRAYPCYTILHGVLRRLLGSPPPRGVPPASGKRTPLLAALPAAATSQLVLPLGGKSLVVYSQRGYRARDKFQFPYIAETQSA